RGTWGGAERSSASGWRRSTRPARSAAASTRGRSSPPSGCSPERSDGAGRAPRLRPAGAPSPQLRKGPSRLQKGFQARQHLGPALADALQHLRARLEAIVRYGQTDHVDDRLDLKRDPLILLLFFPVVQLY